MEASQTSAAAKTILDATRPNRHVVVTGASSGIGRAIALRLDAEGWNVLATVRHPEDASALKATASAHLETLLLDLTDPASIAQFAESVRQRLSDQRLDGLVNNAGMVIAGPLEAIPIPLLRQQLDVNCVGHIAVIQQMLPLLRNARGRIVNIGSVSAYVSLPFLGPYAASKFAFAALTDALRVEVRPFGVRVSMVHPGNTATPLWQKAGQQGDHLEQAMAAEARGLYGKYLARLRQLASQMEASSAPLEGVCQAVLHALTSRWSRSSYYVGLDAKWIALLTWILPRFLRDRIIMTQLHMP